MGRTKGSSPRLTAAERAKRNRAKHQVKSVQITGDAYAALRRMRAKTGEKSDRDAVSRIIIEREMLILALDSGSRQVASEILNQEAERVLREEGLVP